jgi:Na+/H+-translocating membrane pyrophosphatase
MVLAGVGIMLSILSIYFVKTEEGATQMNLLWALRRGVWGSSGMILIAAAVVCYWVLPAEVWLGVFGAIATGLLAGVAIGWFTEYYTSSEYEPTKWIATQCKTGPATTIIGGIAQGMLSSWASIAIVGVGTILAYAFAGGFTTPELGLYGIGIAAVGMLATLGITLATDAYGPIADNAGGNAQMTHQPEHVRERTDALDSLGNTTAATGKGFAIGSAALTALALLAAFIEEVRVGIQREGASYVAAHSDIGSDQIVSIGYGKFVQKTASPDAETGFYPTYMRVSRGVPHVIDGSVARRATEKEISNHYIPEIKAEKEVFGLVQLKTASLSDFMEFYRVNLMNPKLLVGMFLGVLMVFVFCGLTMKAVGRAAGAMVDEVRRQFRELNLLSDVNAKADYATCVGIATTGAQREMILPSLLAVSTPLVIGMVLDVSGVMGLLAGGLTCGFAVAVFMANAGGAWDNAKKYIEAGNFGGKGSDAHKAGVVGDTVGDPFKDTSGPSLNILIKLMSMVAVVFAGVIVKYAPMIGAMLGIGD